MVRERGAILRVSGNHGLLPPLAVRVARTGTRVLSGLGVLIAVGILVSPSQARAGTETGPEGAPSQPPAPISSTPGAAPGDLKGVVIGAIRIETVEIFDPSNPEENRSFYRLVNRLHIKSREQTIRRQLLFAEGEPLVPTRLEDTERNLRALSFVQDASVEIESIDEGKAVVLVKTQDNWTTRLGVRFGSAGGKSTGGVSISELNLLGWGKRIDLDYRSGIDRTSRELVYQDPNVLGSPYRIRLSHQDSNDGKGDAASFQRPWYSLETPVAWGAEASRNTSRFSLFQGGDVLERFDQDARDAELWLGFGTNYRKGSVERWVVGYLYEDNTYTPASDLPTDFPADKIPDSDTNSGPYVEFARIRRDFIKVRYFERFSRWEDYNLGGTLNLRLQVSREGFGGTSNSVAYGVSYSKGARISPVNHLLGHAFIKGRVGDRDQGAGHVDLINYYTAWPRQTFVFKISGDRMVNQSATNLLLLGGDSGLRGFKVRRFEGTNRFLINLEDRLHFEREYFKLLRLGMAVFLDVGNAWGGTRTEEQRLCELDPLSGTRSCQTRAVSVHNDFGNLKADVGFAILADVVRASAAGFVRLNFAYPVNGDKFDQGSILISFGRSGGF